MLYRTALVGAGLLLVSFISAPAAAQPKPDPGMPQVDPHSAAGVFGARGQLAIMGETGAVFTHTSVSGGSSSTFVLRPAIDYFVIDHLSVGAFTGLEYSSTPASSTTTYGIGPRVGYDIPLSERFSVWPKAGLSFNSSKVTLDPVTVGGFTTPERSDSNSALAINLYVPLMFHSHHYFAGLGPSVDADITGSPKATTIAARLVVGGWLFE
jgi:outer membrane protein with beta-barrel domain